MLKFTLKFYNENKAKIRSLIKAFFSPTDAQVTCLKKILKFTLKFYN